MIPPKCTCEDNSSITPCPVHGILGNKHIGKDLDEFLIEHGLENVIEYGERMAIHREDLCRNSPKCPKCHTDQVQLVEWCEESPAIWKCRQRFYFELITQEVK